MARILVLCSRLPYPPIGGARLRMFNIASLLGENHEVDLLIVTSNSSPDDVEILRERFNGVTVLQSSPARFYANALRGLASRMPLQTYYYRIREASKWLDAHGDRYDLYFCNHVRTAEYVRLRDTPKVIDLVDAISRNYAEARRYASGPWRLIYPLEARRLRRYEPRVVAEFDHALITTDADKRYIRCQRDVGPISVVPNGVRAELLEKDTTFELDNDRIVFLGKMDYEPNVDAVTYFADEILPLITAEAECQFTIVGAPVADRVQSLDARPGIEVTGFVDEPADYLSTARVVVAPLRFGAGIQNKVLEAMALGRTVVTTPLGAEGIRAVDGEHLVVADDRDAYAAAVVELLSNVDDARRIGTAARHLIEREYRWEHIAERLNRVVNQTLWTTPA